jgi:hypothetical protein
MKVPRTGATLRLPNYRFNTCTSVVIAGVREMASASNLTVSPNPTSDVAFLNFNNPNAEAHTLEVLSVTGQVVRSYSANKGNQFAIEKGNMNAGLYFARLTNTRGENATVKFVVE